MSDPYDMIDRFLRNNLGDEDYAEYSDALDSLCSAQPAQAVPSDVVRLLQGASDWICDHVPAGTHAATTWAKKLQDAAIAAQGDRT